MSSARCRGVHFESGLGFGGEMRAVIMLGRELKIVGDGQSEENPFAPYYSKTKKPPSLGTEAVLNALVLVNEDARRANRMLGTPTQLPMVRRVNRS